MSQPTEFESDFFYSRHGTIQYSRWRRITPLLSLIDAAMATRIAVANLRAWQAANMTPSQKVLVAAVEVPGREADLARVVQDLCETKRHHVDVAIARMEPMGKFANINRAISTRDLTPYDWLLVLDDDIEAPAGFLDRFLYLAYKHDLRLAQPAHRYNSYKSFLVTERHWGTLVRRTEFVECGPVTLFHRETFAHIVPFPTLRWSLGIDVSWADLARCHDWKLGIIDAVPIKHLRPVGATYPGLEATQEAREFLRAKGITMSRREVLKTRSKLA